MEKINLKKNLDWGLFRKVAGAVLLVLGFLALVTPLTPGSWLIFVGAEMLGIGLLSRDNLKRYYKKVTGRTWDVEVPRQEGEESKRDIV